MATREEITILISYVLGNENKQLLIEQGLGSVPKEARIAALRGLQDLGWINHGGYADFGESYSLTKDGRRVASERLLMDSMDPAMREHIEALRLLGDSSECTRKKALRKLVEQECELGNWDSALIYSFDLKKASENTKDTEAEAFACFCEGRVQFAQSRWEEALESYLEALGKYMDVGDRKGVCDTNRAMGTVYGNKGDHASAVRCFETSLSMARSIGDRDAEAKALGNLAIIHAIEGRFDESEKANNECLKYFLEKGDLTSAGRTANNLGVMNMSRERFEVAAEYFDKTISSARALRNKQMLGAALVNAGYCHARVGQIARALGCTDEAIKIFREPSDMNMLALAYRNYGRIELRNSRVHEAFGWYEKSVRAAKGSGVEDTFAACCYDYGIGLIESMTDLRLAKKLLKRSCSVYRNIGNTQMAYNAEARLSAV